jgi:hypothetical protein
MEGRGVDVEDGREKDTRSRGVSKNRSRAEWILIWSRGKAMRAALLRSVSFEV